MALVPGTRLGPYEIGAQIGAGGMGVVYRARDTKLQRDVAIKVLPETLAHDPERLARFEREARTLAALNHPNIAHIHGLHESDGPKALVMELVEGPTLADRIAHGAIPVDEALPIARQIAEALEAAHEQGIIHRDLKPANVKVRPDGVVKVLDFGLAKALEPVSAGSTDATTSPTITSPALMTRIGVILGTAAYMSPEQAKRRAADKRSDIWAFGCVLYEMLTGRRAFEGQDAADVLARILERDPDFKALPATVPPVVRRLLRRALEKNPRDRLAAAADARLDLEEVLAGRDASIDAVTHADVVRRHRVLAYGAAVLAGAALVSVPFALALRSTSRTDDARVFTSSILAPANTHFVFPIPASSMAVAPDGRHVAFMAAGDDGVRRLWVRNLETGASRMLAGTDNASDPFWSADSESVGFMSATIGLPAQLKTVALRGGAPLTVGGLGRSAPTWNRDGIILFTDADSGHIYQIPASGGGASSPVTKVDVARGETEHWYPVFLPDGRHFLFLAVGTQTNPLEPNGIFVGSVDSVERTLLVPGGSNAQYANGHLLFLRGQTLFAQRFDPDTLQLSGSPVPLAEKLLTGGGTGRTGAFSVSDTVLVYRTGEGVLVSRLAWYDRSGRLIRVLGDEAEYNHLDLSPDGSRLAVSIVDPVSRTRDIWWYDVERGVRSRITSMSGDAFRPVWMSGGREILFIRSRLRTAWDIYRRALVATSDEVILADEFRKVPTDVRRDNRFALFMTRSGHDGPDTDIGVLPLGGGAPVLIQSPFSEGEAVFSPDGRWIAYHVETRPGRFEVYVMPFGRAGERIPVSSAGGAFPRWSGDGTELFYAGPNNEVIAVAVSLNGGAVRIGTPRALFEARPNVNAYPWFDVSPNGQQIVVNELPEEEVLAPLTVVVNWAALVKP
jgi:Tol biopolymer transport system component/tRNA A-37 threonylcarbamoyl transferase component Bud32